VVGFVRNEGVTGSNPVSSTYDCLVKGQKMALARENILSPDLSGLFDISCLVAAFLVVAGGAILTPYRRFTSDPSCRISTASGGGSRILAGFPTRKEGSAEGGGLG